MGYTSKRAPHPEAPILLNGAETEGHHCFPWELKIWPYGEWTGIDSSFLYAHFMESKMPDSSKQVTWEGSEDKGQKLTEVQQVTGGENVVAVK